jgi:hypothetical protein
MTRCLVGIVSLAVCLGCGPRAVREAEEPEGEVKGETVEEGEAEVEVEVEEEEEGPQEIVGSAKQDEVEPMKVKDFHVGVDLDFSPSLDPDKKEQAIQRIGGATAGITTCYRKLTEVDEKLEGDIEAVVKISVAGVAKPVTVGKNTTESPELEKCVVAELKKQKYPKKLAGGAVTATVVFTFSPYKQ